MAALFNAVISNPARFGFTNVTQPGIPIRTKIGANDRDFIRLSTGFQTEFTNSLFLNLGYETIVGKDNFRDNYLNATVRYQF